MWYAAAVEGDVNNARAKEVLSAVDAPLTSDHVLAETWLLLSSRIGRRVADAFWDGIRKGAARVEIAGEADLEVAWQIGQDFPDQDFSIVDRTSFAVMMRLGLTRAASFDDHFAVFRFGPRKSLAFEVLR